MTPTDPPPRPVMLYDGACGLCARGVQFILRHERAPTLRFAALDSDFARAVFARPGAPALPADTFALVTSDGIHFRSEAALRCAAHLRAPWRWLRIFRWVPRRLRDALYDAVATRRLRFFGKAGDACVFDPQSRGRFIS